MAWTPYPACLPLEKTPFPLQSPVCQGEQVREERSELLQIGMFLPLQILNLKPRQ